MDSSVEDIALAYHLAIEAIFQCSIAPEEIRHRLKSVVLKSLENEIANLLSEEANPMAKRKAALAS